MRYPIRVILIALTVAPLAVLTASAATRGDWMPAERRAVVHLGSYADDPAAAGSAMLMAVNLQSNGAAVTLFLDRDGVGLADVREPGVSYAGAEAVELLQTLIEGGGRVVLCPPGAAQAGIGRDQLRPGTEIGSPPVIAELILEADLVIDF
jgi:sulfur relay (sulfurtransferase) complex TusBCD TusD component (DsrE family)